MKLFELFATLGLDTSDFDKGVKGAQGKMSNLEKTLGNGLEKASKITTGVLTAAGTALAGFTKTAVNNAATVIAENAAFKSTFGEMADEAKSAYSVIGEQAKILGTRLQATGTKGYSQLKGAGLSANEALDASTRLLTLAADGAAYYDQSLENVDERLRSFLRGNVEAGDSIGLFTSEMQRNNKALDLYGKKWDKLTEAQRQLVMLDIAEEIYKQSGVIGQAAAESDGWANTISNLQEAWEQTTAKFGEPIIEAITPAINGIVETLQSEKVQTALTEFGSFVGGGLSDAIVGFNDALQWSIDNKDKVKTAFEGIAGAAIALTAIKHPLATASTAVGLFIVKVSDAIEKSRVLAEEEAPKLAALASASGAPPEAVPGIADTAESVIVVGETIAEVGSNLVSSGPGIGSEVEGSVANAKRNFIQEGISAFVGQVAELYVESASKQAQEELKESNPFEAVQLYAETGNTDWIPDTLKPAGPLTQSDLAGIAANAGLSPQETQLLMQGKYSPTLMAGGNKTTHPDVLSLAPYIDQELLAKDAPAAIREAEKAYRDAGEGAYEMTRHIFGATEATEAATKATEAETISTQAQTKSVSDAEQALSEYVMGIFRAEDGLEQETEATETQNQTLEELLLAVEEAKNAEEELGQTAVETSEQENILTEALEEAREGAKKTENAAIETAEAIKNMFPTVSASNIEESAAAASVALSLLQTKAAATAAAVSAVFSSSYALNALYGAGYFATGLERVPYDGFPAILHKDEMVLDRKDANAYRNGDAPGPSKGGVTVNQYIQAVPQTASELAFQTMNALEMLRFSV